MNKDDQFRQDIIEAIKKIQMSVAGLSYETFVADADVLDACVRRLEIIGEAVKRLSEKFKTDRPNISWKEIAGFRDKAIHDYASLNAGVVWETISMDLPPLLAALQ